MGQDTELAAQDNFDIPVRTDSSILPLSLHKSAGACLLAFILFPFIALLAQGNPHRSKVNAEVSQRLGIFSARGRVLLGEEYYVLILC